MTRHGRLAFASLFVSLLLTVGASAVRADDPDYSGGGAAPTGPATAGTRLCAHPAVAFPVCFTRQADGMWLREDLVVEERGAEWVVVGEVTTVDVLDVVEDAPISVLSVGGSRVAGPYMESFTPATGLNR